MTHRGVKAGAVDERPLRRCGGTYADLGRPPSPPETFMFAGKERVSRQDEGKRVAQGGACGGRAQRRSHSDQWDWHLANLQSSSAIAMHNGSTACRSAPRHVQPSYAQATRARDPSCLRSLAPLQHGTATSMCTLRGCSPSLLAAPSTPLSAAGAALAAAGERVADSYVIREGREERRLKGVAESARETQTEGQDRRTSAVGCVCAWWVG
jgi:hypothetical protein